jgi:hypothetical protein
VFADCKDLKKNPRFFGAGATLMNDLGGHREIVFWECE